MVNLYFSKGYLSLPPFQPNHSTFASRSVQWTIFYIYIPHRIPLAIILVFIPSIHPNHRSFHPTLYTTLHNSLTRAFSILFNPFIPENFFKIFICTTLIQELSFSLYTNVSLQYTKAGTSSPSCRALIPVNSITSLCFLRYITNLI